MRKYTVGINVHNADELEGMGASYAPSSMTSERKRR